MTARLSPVSSYLNQVRMLTEGQLHSGNYIYNDVRPIQQIVLMYMAKVLKHSL